MRKRGGWLGAAVLLALLSGCGAPTYWRYVSNNTGATEQDFMNIRYQCLRETQQRVSGAYVNAYGGAAGSTVVPTCSAFHSCLAAHGFYRVADTPDPSVFNQPGNYYVPQSAAIQCSQ